MPDHTTRSEPSERPASTTFAIAVILVSALALAMMPERRSPVETGHAPHTDATDAPSRAATPPLKGDAAPVLDPAQALAAFRLVPGLRISVAAAEPTIVAPVAATFDEDGRLWVVQMRTYMPDLDATDELRAGNRITILEDTDHDGVFDSSSVFADGLVLPRAVAPCYAGALVLEPPTLFFCRVADDQSLVKVPLLSGFPGRENPEHAPNGLVYGIDNWYHFSQHSLDVRYDGNTLLTRPTPTIGQWGLTTDAAGRTYTTPNSDPLLIDLLPRHYGARNPHLGGLASLGRSIVPDKSVYPVHPTPGVNRGYQANVLRADKTLNTVTAVCGPLIYDAEALGAGFRASAFVCEPAGNVVKRYVFTEKDSIPRGSNPYDRSEFLASPDERFRPVNLVSGPDGALYILDMYRGLIQHKTFVTPYLAEQVRARSLENPLDLGRIYRVSAADERPIPPPRLSAAGDDELVRLLAHEDQWYRLTAQRLLVERRAVRTAPRLRELARTGSTEAARHHALWTLEGLRVITPADALASLDDPSPVVRASAIRCAEPFLAEPGVLERLRTLADDPDQWVRAQLACTLGELEPVARVGSLVPILKRFPAERFTREAAISGLKDLELPTLRELVQDPDWCKSKDARYVLEDLTDCVLRTGDRARAELVDYAASLASDDDPAAGPLLRRIRVMQRLDSDKPRPLALSREPSRWISSQAERFNSYATQMAESEVYFDWPGRPPVRRVQGTRPLTGAETDRFNRGRIVFATSCASCHQANGAGSSGQGPSLAASPIAEGDAQRFASMLIHGLEGTWKMGDLTYEAAMPPAPVVGDEDLAAVMTYVRRSFGNAADPVTPADVAQARAAHKDRAGPWSRSEIEGK